MTPPFSPNRSHKAAEAGICRGLVRLHCPHAPVWRKTSPFQPSSVAPGTCTASGLALSITTTGRGPSRAAGAMAQEAHLSIHVALNHVTHDPYDRRVALSPQ